jgi:hypothetical protein
MTRSMDQERRRRWYMNGALARKARNHKAYADPGGELWSAYDEGHRDGAKARDYAERFSIETYLDDDTFFDELSVQDEPIK